MSRRQKIYLNSMLLLILIICFSVFCFAVETLDALVELSNEVQTLKIQVANNTAQSQDVEKKIIMPEYQVAYRSEREMIESYIEDICSVYDMDSYFVKSIVQQESEYKPDAENGDCKGLMQVSKRWHKDRAERLGITDFFDPRSNILLGVDYLSELFKEYKDPKLVLMLYSMNNNDALRLYRSGHISKYARDVLARAEEYRKGD